MRVPPVLRANVVDVVVVAGAVSTVLSAQRLVRVTTKLLRGGDACLGGRFGDLRVLIVRAC
jgi:hypothetical protein